MIGKIAYIWYPTTDMDRAVEFYHHLLGFKLLFQREDWSEFAVNGQRFALRKVTEISAPAATGTPGVSFLASPIEDMVNLLSLKGVRFAERPQEYPYGKIASFRDPDGNILGLYEPPPSKGE